MNNKTRLIIIVFLIARSVKTNPTEHSKNDFPLFNQKNQATSLIYFDSTCTICLENKPQTLSELKILACGHTFCKDCWKKEIIHCPICRALAYSKALSRKEKRRFKKTFSHKQLTLK